MAADEVKAADEQLAAKAEKIRRLIEMQHEFMALDREQASDLLLRGLHHANPVPLAWLARFIVERGQ